MQFRRALNLAITPGVVLIGAGLWLVGDDGVRALVIVGLLVWLVSALVHARFRLEITDDRLVMHGYFGGPVVVDKRGLVRVSYRRMDSSSSGRSVQLSVLLLTGADGKRIRVWRYGWLSRRELFSRLQAWIDDAAIPVDEPARAFLARAAS